MEQKTLLDILSGGYGEILETHAMWQCIAALGVKPFKDGNQWSFLYGDNIQEGICGFGDTIFLAAMDFYHNIKTESAEWGASHAKTPTPFASSPALGEVHHALSTHYIVIDQKELTARLKKFPEGARVDVYIEARKGEDQPPTP